MSDHVYSSELRDRASAMRSEGHSYRVIAKRLSVSTTTVYRWLNPEYAEIARRSSREAKRRRTGTCVDCGRITRYNGHRRAVSDLCLPCAARRVGDTRVGDGPIIRQVIALLASGVPVSFTTIRAAIVSAGGRPEQVNPLLYQLLVGRGLATRVARGVYIAGPALQERRAA